jgi:LacI family transcriptional regulator
VVNAQTPRRSPPTIMDVAVLAGVSVSTVSKAINGGGQLRAETRTRVLEAARELGFEPNAQAKSLVRGRTYTVGLLTSDSFGRFSIPLMQGIEDTLGAGQLSVLLCDARGDAVRERHYLRTLLSRRVDGIIVTGRRTDTRPPLSAEPLAVPVVYAFTKSAEAGDLSLVPDDVHGGRLAAEHLLTSGRRRLAHITGPTRFEAVRERAAGMRAVVAGAGHDLPDGHVLAGEWSEAWGREASRLLVADGGEVDGIFCGSDQIARGASDALRELGVRVPDDVALVGYDNWEVIAAATRPPLTTIDMDLEGLGRAAAQHLLAMIGGEHAAGVARRPCRLVIRESTGVSALRDWSATAPDAAPRRSPAHPSRASLEPPV